MFRVPQNFEFYFPNTFEKTPLLNSAIALAAIPIVFAIYSSNFLAPHNAMVALAFFPLLFAIGSLSSVNFLSRHFLFQWSIRKSGISREKWTVDQNGNGIALEGLSKNKQIVYLIVNGWLHKHERNKIRILKTKKNFGIPTMVILTDKSATSLRTIEIRCDDLALETALYSWICIYKRTGELHSESTVNACNAGAVNQSENSDKVDTKHDTIASQNKEQETENTSKLDYPFSGVNLTTEERRILNMLSQNGAIRVKKDDKNNAVDHVRNKTALMKVMGKLKENGEIEKCINHYTIILIKTYYEGFSSSAIRSHVKTAKNLLESKALPKDEK